MPHEEPRLEATLAGFDIRSPRVDPLRRCLACKHGTPNPRCLPALRHTARENLAKSPVVVWNVQRPPALR